MFRSSRFSLSVLALSLLCAASAHAVEPIVVDDSLLKPRFTTMGGASVLPTTRTVPHWYGTTLNPNDGITYGYNMVGADRTTAPVRRAR